MTDYPFFQIDAFASQAFEGNQACVMPMDAFLPDADLQAIAAENNVAETAFIVADGPGIWKLRWFTPAVEVPLCGHATLASAHVLFEHLGFAGEVITFRTVKSGELTVTKLSDGGLEMDFPASKITQIDVSDDVSAALGAAPIKAWAGAFYAAQFETPEDVLALRPDVRALADLGSEVGDWDRGNFGCFALGGANGAEVTSRFFAPGSGIDEDPATGSWHTMLAPIAADLTGKTAFNCRQAFPSRGAWVGAKVTGARVKLTGQAVTVIEGVFHF